MWYISLFTKILHRGRWGEGKEQKEKAHICGNVSAGGKKKANPTICEGIHVLPAG